MSADTHHVYSKCTAGGKMYLQTSYTGTRSECSKFIGSRVRQNLPTHFMFISKLDIDKASKRYLP